MKKKDWLVIAFLLFLSLFTLKDLLKPGFFTSHDGILHIARQYYFHQAITDGQIPVRWNQDAYNGYGYPIFIFSYKLPYIVGSLFHSTGISLIDSVKITFILGYILSGLTMFLFLKSRFGIIPGFVGSIVYQFAPYRFLNIFVRGALAESVCFIFPPLILLSFYFLQQERRIRWRWVVLGSISQACFILSNITIFFIFYICFAIYTLYGIFSKKISFEIAARIGLVFLFGLSLSSYYLIPALINQTNIIYSKIIDIAFIQDSLLNFSQLLYSPWGYGWMKAKEGGMSFQVGIAQWLVLVATCYYLVINRLIKTKISHYSEAVFWLLIVIGSFVIILPQSFVIWKTLSFMLVIQFAWRLLSLIVFALSILAAILVTSFRAKLAQFVIAGIFISLSIYANRNHLRINESQIWSTGDYLRVANSTTSYNEFLPKWVNPRYTSKKRPLVEVLEKNTRFSISRKKTNLIEMAFDLQHKDNIRINIIYYPGWLMFVDNAQRTVQYDKDGVLELTLPEGKHIIKLVFAETLTMKIADIITVISIALLIYFGIRKKRVYEKD